MSRLTVPEYQKIFVDFLNDLETNKQPENLYRPISYIMALGGKRLRPTLTLMGADLFGGDIKKALPAAMAVEVFHNFSLVHDDIMDDAPLRRGKTTVHEKWDVNTGILSGDAMLIQAYKHLEMYEGTRLAALFQLFSKTALEVCEGQQYDVDFETRNDVTLPEYLRMIEYKTSVLIAAALKMGAIVAGAPQEDQELIYEYGRNLGIAFQLQDDYLDAFGNPESFGKQLGGDIIANKKTFLYLTALENATDADQASLLELFAAKLEDTTEKIQTVKAIFKRSGAVDAIKAAMKDYTESAFQALDQIKADDDRKSIFKHFGQDLMSRRV